MYQRSSKGRISQMPGAVSPGIFFLTLKKAAAPRWAKEYVARHD
jgi:hypothetical protein